MCYSVDMTKTTETLADSLRMLADHLDAHPTLVAAMRYALDSIDVFAGDQAEFAALTRELGGTLDNPVTKSADTNYLEASREFGQITLTINVPKTQTCERVVVGQRTVPARVEDIVEWVCPDSFMAPK